MGTGTSEILNIADVVYLTPENAEFYISGDFTGMTFTSDDGEKREYERIILHRDFPFEFASEFISVLDTEQKEIGIVRDLGVFPEDTRHILWNDLSRKYYVREIRSVLSIRERPGYSYWKVGTDAGEMTFTLKDTFRSIFKISERRVIIQDVDANRFEIRDLNALDRRSFKRMEIYL